MNTIHCILFLFLISLRCHIPSYLCLIQNTINGNRMRSHTFVYIIIYALVKFLCITLSYNISIKIWVFHLYLRTILILCYNGIGFSFFARYNSSKYTCIISLLHSKTFSTFFHLNMHILCIRKKAVDKMPSPYFMWSKYIFRMWLFRIHYRLNSCPIHQII